MKRYLFKIELSGLGDTEADAWADAVESFCADPGEPHETTELPGDPFSEEEG